jgi:hypothetical protein
LLSFSSSFRHSYSVGILKSHFHIHIMIPRQKKLIICISHPHMNDCRDDMIQTNLCGYDRLFQCVWTIFLYAKCKKWNFHSKLFLLYFHSTVDKHEAVCGFYIKIIKNEELCQNVVCMILALVTIFHFVCSFWIGCLYECLHAFRCNTG